MPFVKCRKWQPIRTYSHLKKEGWCRTLNKKKEIIIKGTQSKGNGREMIVKGREGKQRKREKGSKRERERSGRE
jgi:hypothetical protein